MGYFSVYLSRQKCGESDQLVTTKICFTYPDASWFCRYKLYPNIPDSHSNISEWSDMSDLSITQLLDEILLVLMTI